MNAIIPEKVSVTTKIDVSIERIKDLLTSAFEGGSNYWIDWVQRQGAKKTEAEYLCDVPFVPNAYVEVKEYEDDGMGRLTQLDFTAIQRGLDIMAEKYPKHFGDFLQENDDATTADVFLQCCLFGEAIYG